MVYEEIQADTTEEVSLDSCRKLIAIIDGDFFIEDTGLYIGALGGFPGPYSSFVQKTIGNDGILKLVDGKDRSAEFVTVITMNKSGKIVQFRGVLKGRISDSIAGEHGFGYDPVFLPEGSGKTLAQMEISEKNRISHRADAVRKLADYLDGGQG